MINLTISFRQPPLEADFAVIASLPALTHRVITTPQEAFEDYVFEAIEALIVVNLT